MLLRAATVHGRKASATRGKDEDGEQRRTDQRGRCGLAEQVEGKTDLGDHDREGECGCLKKPHGDGRPHPEPSAVEQGRCAADNEKGNNQERDEFESRGLREERIDVELGSGDDEEHRYEKSEANGIELGLEDLDVGTIVAVG